MFLRTPSPKNSLPATSMPSCLLLSPPRSPPGILEKVGGSGNSPAPSPFEGKPGSRHFGHDPRRGNPSVRRYDAARWPGRTARVAILPLKNPGGIREWESHSRMRPPFAIGRGIRAWASLRHSPSECPEASRMPIRLRKGKSAFAQAELHSAGTSRPPGWSTPIREWTPPKRGRPGRNLRSKSFRGAFGLACGDQAEGPIGHIAAGRRIVAWAMGRGHTPAASNSATKGLTHSVHHHVLRPNGRCRRDA